MTSGDRVPLGRRISRWIFGDGERAAEAAAVRARAAELDVEHLREEEAHARAMRDLEAVRILAGRIARKTPAPMPRPVSIPDLEGSS